MHDKQAVALLQFTQGDEHCWQDDKERKYPGEQFEHIVPLVQALQPTLQHSPPITVNVESHVVHIVGDVHDAQ